METSCCRISEPNASRSPDWARNTSATERASPVVVANPTVLGRGGPCISSHVFGCFVGRWPHMVGHAGQDPVDEARRVSRRVAAGQLDGFGEHDRGRHVVAMA